MTTVIILLLTDDDGNDRDAMPEGYSPSAHAGEVGLNSMQGVTVYRLHHGPFHVYIRWRTYTEDVVDLANRLRIPLDEIITYHPLAVPLVEQNLAEANIMFQHAGDLPVGSADHLILLDVEIHQNAGQHALPATPHVARKVCRLTQHVVRSHLLMHAGVFWYCQQKFDRCLVHVNGQIWPLQDVAALILLHGGYIQVVVPPPLHAAGGTLQAIDLVERQFRTDLPHGVQAFHRPAQVRLPEPIYGDQALAGPSAAQHPICHSMTSAVGLQAPRAAHAAAPSPPLLQPPQPLGWLLPTVMMFRQKAEDSDESGQAEVEWVTWYLQAPLRTQSEESRNIRLDVEQHLCFQQICALWADRWIPYLPGQFFVVAPEPPRAPHQHHVGHLLLVQGTLPLQVPVLFSMVFESRLGRRHLACFLSELLSLAELTNVLRLERVCHDRGCYAEVGDFPVPPHGLAHV